MKGKGIGQILAAVVVIALSVFVAVAGFGSSQSGSIHDIKLGLDLAGGVSITYQTVKEDPDSSEISDTQYKMQLRADSLSTESAVYLEGERRITVDIPDVKDADAVLEQLGAAGKLYFVYGQGPDGVANIERYTDAETGEPKYRLTRSMDEILADGDVVIDGSCIANAQPTNQNTALGTEYLVELSLNSNGTQSFADATRYAVSYSGSGDIRNTIAIVYDNEVISAPGVQSVIDGGVASITGQANFDESKTLASIIRIGALPLELEVLKYNVVGARLGSDAISSSLLAGMIGLILVMIFMICWYRVPGLAASIALVFYTAMMIIFLSVFNVTLTLSGIAGIILSIGMAVDANVIIFTRIQEEIATGKTVRSSIKAGFSKALSAIIDGNVTTLIAAAVLYILGVGTVKGFAQTLAIGIVLSMITALFVTKFILLGLYNLGATSEKLYGTKKERKSIPFTKNFKKFAIGSGAVIAV
ncbi:MAG: protein translocase subunit SecD, partial [Lachnospiraceae bacterium]|nr:protein translocase subunit SecD [Lachnospiraceae bacterium]